ncbi:class IIb bacteriocin, lactobin A/cerein 7B family [Bacillus mycoides]|uniref:class IIb bacteriocin, lactobin A/cerein 7B family n=1 Tax=Bacillus mycoides TaxID=1405 RepID=UPI001C027E4A|nr:class IIb bacteriocin, lactobin A/cerein 7B family [Bacillus mycoides]
MEQNLIKLESVLNNSSMEELDLNEACEIDGGIVPVVVGVGAGVIKIAGYVTAGATIAGAGYVAGKWVGRHF